MNSNNIEVSICCITYNHVDFIRDAINSFINQKTTFNYEILIHDDCSTDGTTEILSEYEKKYPNLIRVIYESKNQFSLEEKKALIMDLTVPFAKGKYIAICEGDDFWCDENKLQKQYDILESHEEYSCSFHDAKICDYNGHILSDSLLKSKKEYDKEKSKAYDCNEIIKMDFYPTASIFFRKECIEQTPSYFRTGVCEDLPIRISLAASGKSFCFNNSMSVYRIGNPNSASGKIINNTLKVAYTLDVHCKILNDFDEYTDGKYHKTVLEEINIKQFQKYRVLNDFKAIQREPYWSIFKKETLKNKLSTITHYYFPHLYEFIHRAINY